MLGIFITFLTFVLIIVCLFMMLVILMQRASANAGLGSAFGGGAAESAFGADTTNVLVKSTKWSAFAFFGLALVLYLLYLANAKQEMAEGDLSLPTIAVEETAAEDGAIAEDSLLAEEAVAADEAVPVEESTESAEETAPVVTEEIPNP